MIHASASGSLMLMGEHAVLHGAHALCAALSQRLRVELEPRRGREVSIDSSFGAFTTSLDALDPAPPFHFVVETLRAAAPSQGCHLSIHSEFSAQWGFGSSAAVCVATAAALFAMEGRPFDRAAIFETALRAVRAVQGRASGADVAAASYGGIVLYRADPVSIEPFVRSLPLCAVYAGYKTPTPEVIAHVEAGVRAFPRLHQRLFDAMDACVREAADPLRRGDLEQLGHLFRIHQGLQCALGTGDATLAHLIHALEALPSVRAAKISGSGLGDCVIGLGDPRAAVEGFAHTPVDIDPQGVLVS